MMRHLLLTMTLLLALFSSASGAGEITIYSVSDAAYITSEKVIKSPSEWRKLLTPQQFEILREQGTERAYTSPLHNHKGKGIYRCAGCGLDLFDSDTKYDSQSGWPSFYAPVAKENVAFEDDFSFFMRRTEVHCARCDGHLGHVFEDGPEPTGLRYCINGLSLTFVARPSQDS